MKYIDRIEIVLENITNDFISTEKLQKKLGIPLSTMQKDLSNLAKQGLVERKYGEVRKVKLSQSIYLNDIKNIDSKINISKKAASKVKSNMNIFIDAGTTTKYIIDFIDENCSHVTIFTNSLIIANNWEYKSNVNLLLLPGFVSKTKMKVEGTPTLSFCSDLKFDISFFSGYGFDKSTIMLSKEDDYFFKKMILNNSENTYFCLDKSKKNVNGTFTLSSYEKHQLISN